MAGNPGLHTIQIGKESVLGTEIDATTILRAPFAAIADNSDITYVEEDVGYLGGLGRAYEAFKDGTLQVPDMPATFEQIQYFLNAGIKGVAGSQDGTGAGYVWTYDLPYQTVNTPYTYTVEEGDNQQFNLLTGAFCKEFTLKGAAKQALMMAAILQGWPGGQTTKKAGLELPTVDAMRFGLTQLAIDDDDGSYGGTQVTNSFVSFEFNFKDLFLPDWTGEGDSLYYTKLNMNWVPEITLKFTLEHDSTATAEREKRRAASRADRLIQIKCEGGAISDTTGATYTKETLILNLPGSYMSPEKLERGETAMTVPFEFKVHPNATVGDGGQIIVVAELAALP
jgi:hypothetical protein